MMQNTAQIIRNGATTSQKKARRDLCAILEGVLRAIDPYDLVRKHVRVEGHHFFVKDTVALDLTRYKNIYVVGGGKAVYKMALAVERLLRGKVTSGCINIPVLPRKNQLRKIVPCKARHPTPNIQGVYGTKRIQRTLIQAGKNDLIVAVISGGGSALMSLPAEGVALQEKIALTSLLLKTPATIHEINVVRKHLSQIKGGQFACLAYPATLVALYISDIIDDSFDIQASGPTAPDPSTFADAIAILQKYDVWKTAPIRIRVRLSRGEQGLIPETPGSEHEAFCKGKIYNITIGNHQTAVLAAESIGKKLGYHTLVLTSTIQGEAREVAKVMVSIAKQIRQRGDPVQRPALIIAGGETTVHVRGNGAGGRNQELVLSAIPQLQEGMTIVSFGTDGVDGITPIPVAGAIADAATRDHALRKKLDTQRFLSDNDSYNFFKHVRDHLHTGPSGTNVGDIILLAVV